MRSPYSTLNCTETISEQLNNHQQCGKTDAHPSILILASEQASVVPFSPPMLLLTWLIPSGGHCTAVPPSVLKYEDGQGQVERLRAA